MDILWTIEGKAIIEEDGGTVGPPTVWMEGDNLQLDFECRPPQILEYISLSLLLEKDTEDPNEPTESER